MSLSDLKNASASRQKEDEPLEAREEQTPDQSQSEVSPPVGEVAPVADGRTKLLGARVPLSVHREWQGYLHRAREQDPDLTTQSAMPILIRLLRDQAIWQKFVAELAKS